MEDLYLNIYDVSRLPSHPGFHGFSYGMLLVANNSPVYIYYVDDDADERLQYLMNHSMMEVYSPNGDRITIYYGYVTDEKMFFCEQLLYPTEGSVEEDEDSEI